MSAAERIRAFIQGLRPLSAVAVVAANLVPIACVVLFDWNAGILLLLYWAENLVVGAFNAAKMTVSSVAQGPVTMGLGAFMIPFFIVHYGFFCFVHGVFVVVIGGLGKDHLGGDPSPFGLLDLVTGLIRNETGFGWSLVAIAGMHAFSFLFDWIGKGRFRGANPMVLMFQPYGRIVVLHLTLILGALPAAIMGSPVWALVALAVFKTLFDLGMLAQPLKADSETAVAADQTIAELKAKLAKPGQTRR